MSEEINKLMSKMFNQYSTDLRQILGDKFDLLDFEEKQYIYNDLFKHHFKKYLIETNQEHLINEKKIMNTEIPLRVKEHINLVLEREFFVL